MIVNETRDIVADVEDQPDRSETGDAVKINLHEVSNDVSVEKSHCDLKMFHRHQRTQVGGMRQICGETMTKSE